VLVCWVVARRASCWAYAAGTEARHGRPTGANEYDLIWLIKHGREWVENLQDRYCPLAHPLPGPLKGALAPFFPAAILDRVQIAEVGVIQNPPFRDEAIDRGIPPNAIDFTQMEGFTLHDVVLVSMQPKPDQDPEALVFHELVLCRPV
jgi:hypothetical protein